MSVFLCNDGYMFSTSVFQCIFLCVRRGGRALKKYDRAGFKMEDTVLIEKRLSQKGCGGRRRGNGSGEC